MPPVQPILQRPQQRLRPRQGGIPANIANAEEGYTRDVQDNELAINHLNDITNSDSRYIRGMRGRGAAAADAMGVGHGSLYAAAAEGAAIDAAAPFASQAADAYGRAASENLDSLGRQRISNEGNETAMSQTMYSSDTQAGIANLDRDSRERENALDREERDRDRTWRSSESERDFNRNAGLTRESWRFQSRDDYRRAQREVTTGLLSFMMQNPAYFSDPQGMLGAMELFSSELDRIWGGVPDFDDEGP